MIFHDLLISHLIIIEFIIYKIDGLNVNQKKWKNHCKTIFSQTKTNNQILPLKQRKQEHYESITSPRQTKHVQNINEISYL